MKMHNIEKALDDIDYDKIKPKKTQKRNTPYEDKTNFKTVKEAFFNSLEKYPENICILEKTNHKEAYKLCKFFKKYYTKNKIYVKILGELRCCLIFLFI